MGFAYFGGFFVCLGFLFKLPTTLIYRIFRSCCTFVLVPAKRELNFFMVASVGFWICDENSIDNAGIFHKIAEQSLHSVKASSVLSTTGLEVHKMLGGNTAGTADPI